MCQRGESEAPGQSPSRPLCHRPSCVTSELQSQVSRVPVFRVTGPLKCFVRIILTDPKVLFTNQLNMLNVCVVLYVQSAYKLKRTVPERSADSDRATAKSSI